MRSGKLDQVIEVRRTAYVDDGYGNQIPDGTTSVATLRAQIVQASTEEFIRSWGANSEALRIFRTRWFDDINLGDTIRHDDVDYDMKEIKPIGRRRGIELRCLAA